VPITHDEDIWCTHDDQRFPSLKRILPKLQTTCKHIKSLRDEDLKPGAFCFYSLADVAARLVDTDQCQEPRRRVLDLGFFGLSYALSSRRSRRTRTLSVNPSQPACESMSQSNPIAVLLLSYLILVFPLQNASQEKCMPDLNSLKIW
jgi:hypothetical protein